MNDGAPSVTRLNFPARDNPQKNRLAQESYRSELMNQMRSLEELQKSDGWVLYSQALGSSEQNAYTMMEKSLSAEIARHFGAYWALKQMRNWPVKQLEYIRHQIAEIDRQLSK